MIRANLDKSGELTSVNGYAAPDLDLSVDPRISADAAGKRAVGAVRADPPTARRRRRRRHHRHQGRPTASSSSTGWAPSRATPARRSWRTSSRSPTSDNMRDMVFVDADTNKVINRYSLIANALDRELYEATGTPQAPVITKVWEEGDPFPGTLNEDQQNLVNSGRRVLLALQERLRSRLLRRRGRHDEDGQQRPPHQLPQRQLERRHHQLLQRRHLRRRRVARVGPRLHRVHLRADLPVPAGCPQRVVLRRLGRDRRPDQRSRGRGRGRHHHQASRRPVLEVHPRCDRRHHQQPGGRSPGRAPARQPRPSDRSSTRPA